MFGRKKKEQKNSIKYIYIVMAVQNGVFHYYSCCSKPEKAELMALYVSKTLQIANIGQINKYDLSVFDKNDNVVFYFMDGINDYFNMPITKAGK